MWELLYRGNLPGMKDLISKGVNPVFWLNTLLDRDDYGHLTTNFFEFLRDLRTEDQLKLLVFLLKNYKDIIIKNRGGYWADWLSWDGHAMPLSQVEIEIRKKAEKLLEEYEEEVYQESISNKKKM